MSETTIVSGLVCPAPIANNDQVLLGHGSGGKLSAALVREHILPRFANAALLELGDAAVVPFGSTQLAFSTDAFVAPVRRNAKRSSSSCVSSSTSGTFTDRVFVPGANVAVPAVAV